MNAKTFSKLDNLLNAAHKNAKSTEDDMKALLKHGGEGACADAQTIKKEMAQLLDSLNEAKRILRQLVEEKLPK